MVSVDLIGAKLKAFEMRMLDRLRAVAEFRLGGSPSPRRSQCGESSDRKENPPEEEEQVTNSSYSHIRVDFPRWEDGDPTGWISCVERYFRYHRTLEASMVDIAAIHLGREDIQWYDWYKDAHGVPIWRQFKSGLLICFRSTDRPMRALRSRPVGTLPPWLLLQSGSDPCPSCLLVQSFFLNTRKGNRRHKSVRLPRLYFSPNLWL
ncbi:hypothetical protein GW17_00022224 [Ensete ventricosum]|nr:hypothetical protein GW17_00022224 [Ensete ventricosum]